jgi:F-type H+-transporting ATPase subunit delta
MASSKVAVRYARSFLDTAIEKNVLSKVSQDFELLLIALNNSVELRRAVKSPIIKNETKQSFIEEIFGKVISKDSMSFVNFVITKERENILVDIIEKFISLKDEYLGIVKVDVISAFDFTTVQKTELQQKFETYLNKKVRFSYKIDKNIIGGFVAKVGDTVYNASVFHQLGLLKKQFLLGSVTLN